MDKLSEVLHGFDEEGAEIMFVLIGTFFSKPVSVPGGRDIAIGAMGALADAILSCTYISTTAKFVMVPGMHYYFLINT
jgi:hypothetical protein